MTLYLVSLLMGTIGCPLALGVSAFVSLPPQKSPEKIFCRRHQNRHPTILLYKNESRWEHSSIELELLDKATSMSDVDATDDSISTILVDVSTRRNEIKKELAKAAITNFDTQGKSNYAEDLMKDLEKLRPWERTASRPELNARWSFVFTGVPTIGMRLITLLSRISVGFPVVDFHDVFLEVMDDQSHVRATVSWKVFGIPMELNVHTALEPDPTFESGNVMLETFQSLTLMGVPLPTPQSWAKTRTLDISYLDSDMMVARTAGGEPHLLLRNSRCTTADDECDVDQELTDFFDEAREMYGERIARCLVDRDFGESEADVCASSARATNSVHNATEGDSECPGHQGRRDPVTTFLTLDPKSLFGAPLGGKGPKSNLKP
jgi:hypothetical protein